MAAFGKLQEVLLVLMGTLLLGVSSVTYAAFPVEEVHHEVHHGATCQYCVDGICVPKWESFGYYAPTWRRWPALGVASNAGAAIVDRLPDAILPKKTDEDNFDPKIGEKPEKSQTSGPEQEESQSKDEEPDQREMDLLTNPFADDPLMPTSLQSAENRETWPGISLVGHPFLPSSGRGKLRETPIQDSLRTVKPRGEKSSYITSAGDSKRPFSDATPMDWTHNDASNPLRPRRTVTRDGQATSLAVPPRLTVDEANDSQLSRRRKVNPLRRR